MPAKPIEIFLSYSYKDKELVDKFIPHLALLERRGIVKSWCNRELQAGANWENEISSNLVSANIILLFISADFLASDYSYGSEIKVAIERSRTGDAIVIPIILRSSAWHQSPIAKLQVLPKDGQPIILRKDIDNAFSEVAKEIGKVAESLVDQDKKVQDKRIILSLQVSQDSPTDIVALEISNLCKAVNAYHIACGGSGLVIDDWETFVEVRQLIGV